MLRLPTVDIDLTNTSVGTTLEDVGTSGNTDPEIKLAGGYSRLAFQLTNAHGSNALANFTLMAKTHKDGTWQTLIATTAWATIAGRLLDFDGAPHTLAASATATALINVEGLHQVKFQADADTAGSVTIKGTAVQ